MHLPAPSKDGYRLRIDACEISVRLANSLRCAGYTYLDQLHGMTKEEFLKIPNLGVVSYREFKVVFGAVGLLPWEGG
jgi:DNA-directed RNA polymerase alpha subunit